MKRKICLFVFSLLFSITGWTEMKQVSDGLGNEQGLVVVDRRWSQKPHLAVQPRLRVWVPLLRRENKSRTILYKGSVSIARPASFDLYVILKSSNPMKVKLPPYITLAAGKTNAMFSIRVSSLGSTKGSVVIKGEASGYVSSSAKLSFPKRRRLVVRKVPHKSGNLIVNGDFERGDRGFSSTYRVSSQGVREGVYYVGSSSKAWNYYFSYNVKDHTTGSGLMLLGNGKSKSTPVWEQAVKIKKGETYQFSGWTSSLSKTVHAKLEFSVGGEVVKTVVLKKRWEPFSAQWKSPLSGIVVLSIRDLNTESIGNDFALDDLYFGPSTSAKGGLILHYTFDSDSGRVVVDRSGHGNDGRLMNRCSYVDGVQGKGLKIFGDNQTYGGHGGHVKLPTLDFNSMEGVTIALWVKEVQMHHPHGEAYISFGSINLGNDENILSIQHFHNQMEFVGGTTTLSKPFDLSGRGRFVHYALTYSDGQLCAYRDGVLVQKKAGKLLVDEPSLAALGRHWWTSASHSSTRLTAVFDEVRIYSRALSEREIRSLASKTDSSLIASYPFNGSADDVSGNGYHGVVHGATLTTDRFGNPNSAYYFDGKNDYIRLPSIPNVPALEDYTLSVWFMNDGKGTQGNYGQKIIDKTAYFHDFYISVLRDGRVRFMLYEKLPAAIGSDSHNYCDGAWHHVLIRKKGTFASMWLDGVCVDSCNNAKSVVNSSSFLIGYSDSSDSLQKRFWSGKIDDLRMYNRALTHAEINALAQKTDSSLMASYPFNGSADDVSGNGHNGIVHGATLTTDRFGNPNSAYHFNGHAYIDFGDVLDRKDNSWSVLGWIRTDSYNQEATLINKGLTIFGSPKNSGYGLRILNYSNNLNFLAVDDSKREGNLDYSLNRLPVNEYVFVACTYDRSSATMRLFVNGRLVETKQVELGYSDSNVPFAIGALVRGNGSQTQYYFKGDIDDVTIYSRALTHAEINALAQKTDSSLMASYPFNGSADDVSGNGHNGVVHGATLTTDRFGNPNSAYRFDGEDDYISIPDHPDFTVTDATVCAWIRTSDRSNEKHITSCYGRNTSSEWYHLYIDSESGAGCWQVDPGGPKIPPRVVGTRMIADGEWHFLVGVRDTSSKHLKIYVDGVLQSTVLDHSTKPLDPEVDFWIGGQNGFPQRFFHGEIDDVSVYKRALSSEEILNMYNDDKGLELIAHYSFDGNANDDSGNGHKGIVHGVTLTTDRLGKRNGAYRFDGENDYIRVSDAEALRLSNSDFSIGIWFKEYARNDSYQSVLLAKRGSGSNDGWIFSTQGNKRDSRAGRLYYQVSGGLAPWHQSNQSLELNEWHYAVLTYKKARQELRVYVDGVLDSVCSDMPAPFAEGNSALLIGRDSSSSSYYFNGVIDDIAIYKGILPKSKIVKEYAGQGLMAYFPFDGNANDDSGNGHNGTVYNARLTADRFGHPNRAYYFDGNSSFIDCGNIITNAAQFTVSAWVRVDRFTDPHYMGPWSQQSFSVPRANCNYHMYTGNSGNNCFGISMAWADGADCTVRSGHILPLGEWRLVTQTYDGTFYRLYDNGNLVTKKRMLNHRLISKERFLIGKTCAYPNYIEKPVHFAGMIDDLRIYNRALNAREIKHLLTPKSNVNVDVEISVESFQPTNQQFQIFSGSPKSPVKPEIRLNTIIIEVNKYGEVTLGNTTYSKQNSLADLVQKLKEKKEESQRAGKTICVKIVSLNNAPSSALKKTSRACLKAGVKNIVFKNARPKKRGQYSQ